VTGTVFTVSREVREALDAKRPVVALESTIITHGFAYPANLECALEAERVAREQGVVPATVGVVRGVLTVGMERADIERFASAGDVAKASRRDLPVLAARGADGGTTVAATMVAAARAGIAVFATGGIGGVHRGAERTFDVSADLVELSRTDVAVVCAGAKSVLDIGLTLEYLETAGVPVLGYRTDDFPAFYVPSSGFPVPHRVESPAEVARVIATKRALGLQGGVVVANPIEERHALDPAKLEAVTAQALAAAAGQGVAGKDVTPFLLAAIHEATGGASEEANRQLVYANVRLAARIASALLGA